MNPMVSICCLAYNQKKYIKKTIDSFLSQKTSFDFEIIIHDDASSDGTQDIIRKYVEKYPDKIIPIFQKQNQYSKGVENSITFCYPQARGKYIALCEGDDYWCDDYKLEKQVTIFESNPECTFIFSNGYSYNEKNNEMTPFLPRREKERQIAEYSHFMNLGENLKFSFIPTASFIFRKETLNQLPEEFKIYCPTGDLRTRLYLIGQKKAYYFKDKMVVYRENTPGSVMASWEKLNTDQAYKNFKSILDMLERVNVYTNCEYLDAIREYEIPHRKALLLNTKSFHDLLQAENKIVYKNCTILEKMKILGKIVLPKTICDTLKKRNR